MRGKFLLLLGGAGGGGGTTHDLSANLTIDGTIAAEFPPPTTYQLAAALTIDGQVNAPVALVHQLQASLLVDGQVSAAFPVVGSKWRVVLVATTGATIAELDNAVMAQLPSFPLTGWESWAFNLPVDDPKAHHVLDERIREAQVWRGDLLVSWGPMSQPAVDDHTVRVRGRGASWYLSRRHVGKANRDNQLCNGGFEDGLACWNVLKGAYFLDYAPVADGDARVYAPGLDGDKALELNMDLKPWVSPSGATTSTTHTVVSGDTLWDLARTFYGSGTQWWRIYDANQALIQSGAVAAGLWNPHDPGHWIFPGQVFTIPGITAPEVVTAPDDDGTRWGDVYAFQEFTVAGGVRGVQATLVAWVYVRSDLLEGWGVHRRGVMLQRYASDFRTNNSWDPVDNTWGGWRAHYTDTIESTFSRLDEDHPLDTWVRHECTITVPPGVTEVLHARLSGVEGRTYWDRASLTYDSAFEQHQVDQATIVAELVEHAQDPAFDKNDLNITTEAPATGVRRTLVALHSEHANIWNLAEDFTKYRDGLDLGMRYTPTDRILTTHFPRKGVEHRGLHLQLGRNVASFRWTFDGEAAASSVVLLGTGDGSDREEASAIDADAFADGLVLETVVAVGADTPVEALQELADEKLAVVRNPEVLTVTTYPHDPSRHERNMIGKVWVGDVLPVTIRKLAPVLPDQLTWGEDPLVWGDDELAFGELGYVAQFTVDDDYRVVALDFNPDDSLTLTLNRRP